MFLCVLFVFLSLLHNEGPTFQCAMSSHSHFLTISIILSISIFATIYPLHFTIFFPFSLIFPSSRPSPSPQGHVFIFIYRPSASCSVQANNFNTVYTAGDISFSTFSLSCLLFFFGTILILLIKPSLHLFAVKAFCNILRKKITS